ncbi:zf-TFIIB domain-containing protein [Candidatus Saccharibacteria bacterium]|jgi:Zn-finger nucleic acid-binding protein|nr:zf-TFIIB domain-containing protein [Candidatus Saccharibacteria bacterium]
MKCPVDNSALTISDRQGVEIDFCPDCRGVWLDRGELDKIIDRVADSTPAAMNDRSYQNNQQPRHQYSDHDQKHHYKKKKRESFLGDLFDF